MHQNVLICSPLFDLSKFQNVIHNLNEKCWDVSQKKFFNLKLLRAVLVFRLVLTESREIKLTVKLKTA